ncbi:MAG: HAMP domain-containing histidine kinase [Planctomycetes bacterium]|nr:HAMP domain-containing histidine kinase [Planctomycetota bacterium]
MDQQHETRSDATRNDADSGRASSGELELADLLALWESATERLQQTQNVLRDEVRRLSEELEFKNRQLERKNRLADLGQIAAHVAHEVRNGLAPCTLYLSLLRRRVQDDADSLQVVDKIQTCFRALEVTVGDLLQFTADRSPKYESFEIRGVVEELCSSLAPQLSAQGIDSRIHVPAQLRLKADRTMVRRALLNLVLNAVDVMPRGGELVITATAMPCGVDLEVADSGPGIPEPIRKRLLEPFFTTKSQGTGLGLAIVHRIAEAHGGELQFLNCPEGGAAFTIRIPEVPTTVEES